MDAPQSQIEIEPIELALRELDDRLRIVWNPKSDAPRPGYVDLLGRVGQPINEGRWEIWITAGALDGEPSLVWTWGSELGPSRPYRPISWETVEFFRQWDTANRNVIAEHLKRRAADEAIEAAAQAARDEGRNELAARFATDVLGAREFIGKGADFPVAPTIHLIP